MALDPKYIPLTSIWQLFTDKDTGNFLRNGYVKFWVDTARTVGKPVFQLTGSPPNYSYIQYGFLDTDGSWRVDLNDQGALDLIPYGFPYDSQGNIQLYFIKVYNTDDVEQFSREGWPNITGSSNTVTQVDVNYVANPQFLLHLDLPVTDTKKAGEVRSPVTDIAWGGWTYERPALSTATDFVTFDRFGSDVVIPEKSPRYSLRVECQNPSPGDTFKDVRLKFRDVNKFSSDTDKFTYAFFAQVNSGSSLNASVILIKNYGTGGSTQEEVSLQNITIGSSWALFATSFIFGENTSKTIGALNDDYIQLVIRLPVDSIFDVSFDSVDFALGEFSNPSMPYTTDYQMIYRAISGFMPIPNPDGSDLYLQPRLTATGMEFDHTIIGKIFSSTDELAEIGELLCDGSQYEYSAYSTDMIPYRRLGDKIWNAVYNFYKFGTGVNFVTCNTIAAPPGNIRLTTNIVGAVTTPADGTPATGFTFSNVHTGNTYLMNGYYSSQAVMIKMVDAGTFGDPTAGTSGFVMNNYRNLPGSYGVVYITSISNASGLAGKYFTIDTPSTAYYVWFKVDGVGTDPAPGGTGIEIDLKSTYSAVEVSQCISEAISGKQITNITAVAASAIPAGSYWTFNTVSQSYYVWYKKDGGGTDPAPSGKVPIKVDILSADAIADVALKTLIAINQKYFATPDLRGMFPRGRDSGSGVDPDVALRYNIFSNSFGDEIGTLESSDFDEHDHAYIFTSAGIVTVLGGPNAIEVIAAQPVDRTGVSGRQETRPINFYVNYVIKY